jgi:hypothetical protein
VIRTVASVSVLLLAGCGALQPASVAPVRLTASIPNQPGLIVERWMIAADDGRLDAAIAGVLPEHPTPLYGQTGFRHDGFRAVVISTDDLERLRNAMSSVIPARRITHGEATAWRDLVSRHVERKTVVLENGRMRRLPRGIVSLAARGWSIPTLNGAGLHLQLVPHLVKQGTRPRPSMRPGSLRGIPLANGLEVTLDGSTALIVTSAPSLEEPPRNTVEGESPPTEDPPSVGPPSVGIGPAAPLPPTVAELLLDEDNGRRRSVLILQGTPHPSLRPPTSDQP